ncbi:MAG: hypothetical protein V7K61_30740 [Nostoc sp.]
MRLRRQKANWAVVGVCRFEIAGVSTLAGAIAASVNFPRIAIKCYIIYRRNTIFLSLGANSVKILSPSYDL